MEQLARFVESSEYRHSSGLYYDRCFIIADAGPTSVEHVWRLAQSGQLVWLGDVQWQWFQTHFQPGSPGQLQADLEREQADEAQQRQEAEGSAQAAAQRMAEFENWPIDRLKWEVDDTRSQMQAKQREYDTLWAEYNRDCPSP